MQNLSILIVDDEQPIREMLRMALEMQGHQCEEAASAKEAMPVVVDSRPDLVLLDWMMPDISGLDFLRRLKRDERTREIPVIMLTAKTAEQSAVAALDAGADDYIRKPFAPAELLSRINAVLRRGTEAGAAGTLEVPGLKIDTAMQCVFIEDMPVKLGPTEYRLLEFFMSHPDRAYARSQLLDQVWGGNVYVEERTVDVHIRRLRKALRPPSASEDYGRYIQTVRGTGYRFSTQAA